MIVKAGNGANVYVYNPAEFEDTGLVTPGGAGLSHLVFCYNPDIVRPQASIAVSKTADGSFTRTCDWEVEKSVAEADAVQEIDYLETVTANYTVVLTGSCEDGDYTVTGDITVFNDGPEDVVITDITDSLGNIATDLTCVDDDQAAVTLPHTLAPEDSIVCTYTVEDLDGDETENIAIVSWEFDDEEQDDAVSEPALFTFELEDTIDECVSVDDDLAGDQGTFCINQVGPPADEDAAELSSMFTIEYSFTSDAYEECGEFTIVNTVTTTENDTEDSDTSSATVTVTVVNCPEWCSPGYWRNHLDEAAIAAAAGGFSLNDTYASQFGSAPARKPQGVRQNAPANPTLLQVLQNPQWYSDGAFNNVGDLLSDAHPDVNFGGIRVEDSCPLN